MTNNPRKVSELKRLGMTVRQDACHCASDRVQRRILAVERERMDHMIDEVKSAPATREPRERQARVPRVGGVHSAGDCRPEVGLPFPDAAKDSDGERRCARSCGCAFARPCYCNNLAVQTLMQRVSASVRSCLACEQRQGVPKSKKVTISILISHQVLKTVSVS